jgi:hypothetical protein
MFAELAASVYRALVLIGTIYLISLADKLAVWPFSAH